MLNDLRIALRSLRQNPGFATAAVLTLALGIGANTSIFSVVNGVLLRPLPYPNPGALVQVESVFQSGHTGNVSYPNFQDLRDQNRSFETLAAYEAWTTSAAARDQGFRVNLAQTSAAIFPTLGVEPLLGRVFTAEEERRGTHVAVVSYGFWQTRLGRSTNLADQVLHAGEDTYPVIGVMPPGYDYPAGTEMWTPPEPEPQSRTSGNWHVVGRLKPGVSRLQAARDLSEIARRLKRQYGDGTPMADAAIRPVLEQLVGSVRPALLVLLGAAGLLFLVACANVVNLLLARTVSRQRELALRLALGARPSHLARRFVAESLLLSLAGAVLGVLIAVAGVPALLALEPARIPRAGGVALDWTVLAFALGVSLLAALAIGTLPALRAAKRDVRDALADTRRSRGGGISGHRVRGALVASQLALTIVLLAGAGLLGRSFLKLLAVDPGFRTGGALVMDVWLPDQGDPVARTRFLEELMARLRATPGVAQVGGTSSFPLRSEGPGNGTFLVLQRPDELTGFDDWDRLSHQPGRSGNAEYRVASRDYFGAMGIPLRRGRLFEETDAPDAPHVALISESLARTQWPGQDPLGRLIEFGNMDGDLRPFTVVGVVGDVRDRGAGAPPRPTIYGYYRQRPGKTSSFYIAIQGRFDAGQIMARGRQIAGELDPQVPTRFHSLEDVVSASFADRRFVLLLLGLFGGLALLLATLGVYGLMAYVASERTSEIGVRMALGARREDVVRLLVSRGAALAGAGIAVGLAASLAATRVLASFLYGVGAADPASFAATCLVLLAAALAASWIPARRASRLDPVRALRYE